MKECQQPVIRFLCGFVDAAADAKGRQVRTRK